MENNQITIQPEESYKVIRKSVLTAQSKVYTAVNSAMVQAYWEIGQEIHKACGKNDRAEYGKKLLEYLSEHLTKEFGKGFTVTNLKYMRQFYRAFPIRHTLCDELSWSHYRLLMRIENENARKFYLCYQERISEAAFRKFTEGKSEAVFRIFDEPIPFTLLNRQS